MIYGTRASNIGNFDVPYTKCGYCEEGKTQNISVFGKYLHIFWIPILPLGKKAVSECTHCKRTIEQKEFSPELKTMYKENKGSVKRPFWHWLGLGGLGLLIALATIIGITGETDPRSELLSADEELMVNNPTMESDSISYKIKQIFDNFATDEIKPSEFTYRTKITEDKALVLVQIPKLRKIKKEGRVQAMEMVQLITDSQSAFENKDLYIGIKGLISMILIKTPNYEENSRIAATSELLEFYGPKPEVEKK